MKILIVSTYDKKGGAAKAAFRLLQGLNRTNCEASMLVQYKSSDFNKVITPASRWVRSKNSINRIIDSRHLQKYKNRNMSLFSSAFAPLSTLSKTINSMKPDLVHLHWVADSMLRIEDLRRISVPIVWSLHDMWVFTGGCHYDDNCGKYILGCNSCPILRSNRQNDLSTKVFKRKIKTFEAISGLTIVATSRWLADCAAKSKLLQGKKIVNLPNPLDLSFYKPIKKEIARDILGLDYDKKIILFGAIKATDDPRKGFQELISALRLIKRHDVNLLVAGSSYSIELPDCGHRIINFGIFYDELSLKIIYSAADLLVVPSKQENLSNMIMESLACGTPVVGFNIGGNPDLIDHKENGFLAEPYSAQDLAEGIRWVIDHPEPDRLSDNARQKVYNNFGMEEVASRYLLLYQSVLGTER